MNWYFESLDWQIIIYFPLAFMAARELKQKWRETFDGNLTIDDRQVLQKINIFFLIPLVVLFHEFGHAAAIWAFGGKVVDFHYGFWFGYVVPSGTFTTMQDLIIYLSGSLVQIILGIIALVAALFVSSPPVVALLVYSGLFSIGGTIIIYALLSFTGLYGDWIAIYTSPETAAVFLIGICHVLLASGFLYLIYGDKPKLWFTCKTRPQWKKSFHSAMARIAESPNAANYLSLAWTFYYVGLTRMCKKALARAKELEPERLEIWLLAGALENDQGKTSEAVSCFERIVNSPQADPILKGRSLLAIGHCLGREADEELARRKTATPGLFESTLEAYRQAKSVIPEYGDPDFYLASTFSKAGLHDERRLALSDIRNKKWLDPALAEIVGREVLDIKKSYEKEE